MTVTMKFNTYKNGGRTLVDSTEISNKQIIDEINKHTAVEFVALTPMLVEILKKYDFLSFGKISVLIKTDLKKHLKGYKKYSSVFFKIRGYEPVELNKVRVIKFDSSNKYAGFTDYNITSFMDILNNNRVHKFVTVPECVFKLLDEKEYVITENEIKKAVSFKGKMTTHWDINFFKWLGYSNEESKQKVYDLQHKNASNVVYKPENSPRRLEYYKNKFNNQYSKDMLREFQSKSSPRCLVYYTNIGFSNEEAIELRRFFQSHGRNVSDETIRDFSLYSKICRQLTEQNDFQSIPNYNLRGKDFHLDHKFSIFDGFKEGILPQYISSINNLEILESKANLIKGRKSSISIDELFQNV